MSWPQMRASVVARSRRVAQFAARERVLTGAIGVLLLLVLLAIVAPLFAPPAVGLNLGDSLKGPSLAHPMGTDNLGRDVFARFAEGARISLVVAVIVVTAGALIGGAIGIISGAVGGV